MKWKKNQQNGADLSRTNFDGLATRERDDAARCDEDIFEAAASEAEKSFYIAQPRQLRLAHRCQQRY